MKTLISVAEIKSIAGAGKRILYVRPNTLITPAAKDAAIECKIEIKNEYVPQDETMEGKKMPECCGIPAVSSELISKIIVEVMANLSQVCSKSYVKSHWL
ncbi:hypothetical protein [Halanaerobium congolense]|uniref:hypothetical protein n=1 Tax=Halanaerobium congolense TaxID=54121 RepID=UPI0008815552|nr:hypothetical protein [Halanaerobium congolense]SDH83164.1 ethanolamine utilization protein EutQ [Halanaerobium congolense]SHM76483.1 ethanolamine utilization protein EutQ [Halanaerobium congolense]